MRRLKQMDHLPRLTFSCFLRRRSFLCVVLCLMAVLLVPITALACSVPVFRYGLEHWKADPYRVLLVHRGTLSAEMQALEKSIKTEGTRANLTVHMADLAQSPAPDVLSAWQAAGSPESAALIVLPPATAHVPGVVWSGPLTAASIATLVDSPARKTIASRIGEGESAVWILLESGNKAADDAAASLLASRLDYLGTVMELPKLDEQDVRNGLVSLPADGLQLSFSLVRISRSDPAEKAFTQMLLATEPDLKDANGPIAFPVFGQGRALYALVDKGIKHETIDEAASFLIGSCSCQVKEKNPGADLLMAVDWKSLVRDQSIGLADLPSASEIVGGKPETVTITAPTKSPPPPELSRVTASRIPIASLTLVALIAILFAGVAIWRGRRKNP
jgi:hypothetical protein